MGMFDKDKEIGLILTDWIGMREEFILWNAKIRREDFPTNLGPAVQSELEVSRPGDPGNRYTVTTLASSIAGKVRDATSTDFPAVVFWNMVPTKYGRDATVLTFVNQYRQHNAGQAPDTTAFADRVPREDDDPGADTTIPF